MLRIDSISFEKTPEYHTFINELTLLHKSRGVNLKSVRQVAGTKINLFELYQVVTKLGGFEKITLEQNWKTVVSSFQITPSPPHVSYIKKIYTESLLPYEQEHFKKPLKSFVADPPKPSPKPLDAPAISIADHFNTVTTQPVTASNLMIPEQNTLRQMQFNYSSTPHRVSRINPVDFNLQPHLNRWQDVYTPALKTRLLRALQSELPNEVDFAMNTLLQLAFHNSEFLIENEKSIIDALLLYSRPFLNLQLEVICECERQTLKEDDMDIDTNEPAKECRCFDLVNFGKVLPNFTALESNYIYNIFHILYNLSYNTNNQLYMAQRLPEVHCLIFKALRMPNNLLDFLIHRPKEFRIPDDAQLTSLQLFPLKWYALQILESLGYWYLAEKTQVIIYVLKDMIADENSDRSTLIKSFRILTRLLTKPTVETSTEKIFLAEIDIPFLRAVLPLLTLYDDTELLESVLEFLYKFTNIMESEKVVEVEDDSEIYFLKMTKPQNVCSNIKPVQRVFTALSYSARGDPVAGFGKNGLGLIKLLFTLLYKFGGPSTWHSDEHSSNIEKEQLDAIKKQSSKHQPDVIRTLSWLRDHFEQPNDASQHISLAVIYDVFYLPFVKSQQPLTEYSMVDFIRLIGWAFDAESFVDCKIEGNDQVEFIITNLREKSTTGNCSNNVDSMNIDDGRQFQSERRPIFARNDAILCKWKTCNYSKILGGSIFSQSDSETSSSVDRDSNMDVLIFNGFADETLLLEHVLKTHFPAGAQRYICNWATCNRFGEPGSQQMTDRTRAFCHFKCHVDWFSRCGGVPYGEHDGVRRYFRRSDQKSEPKQLNLSNHKGYKQQFPSVDLSSGSQSAAPPPLSGHLKGLPLATSLCLRNIARALVVRSKFPMMQLEKNCLSAEQASSLLESMFVPELYHLITEYSMRSEDWAWVICDMVNIIEDAML